MELYLSIARRRRQWNGLRRSDHRRTFFLDPFSRLQKKLKQPSPPSRPKLQTLLLLPANTPHSIGPVNHINTFIIPTILLALFFLPSGRLTGFRTRHLPHTGFGVSLPHTQPHLCINHHHHLSIYIYFPISSYSLHELLNEGTKLRLRHVGGSK
jgi:hypothetical protein